MKRMLTAGALFIALVGGLYAATCTEGKITLTGQTCGVVGGHCACTGNGN